jgi:signal peptidase I
MLKKICEFLKKDRWDSWLVSIILLFLIVKFIFFPAMSLITGSTLPLVVIESCSMYHNSDFNEWWERNALWYESNNITKENFESFKFKDGLNKGDIILVTKWGGYQKGDVIIFNANAPTRYPLIHRIISKYPLATKGDHNSDQLPIEKSVDKSKIYGKATLRIPILGWIKLIFFEPFRPAEERGLCK